MNTGDWVVLAIMAIIAALLTANEITAAQRLFAYRRAQLAGPTGLVATAA